MGIKITDMTAGGLANGTEIIPTSKAAAPRSVTAANLKDYVVDQIEAITAGGSVATGNGLYALQAGVLKPVDIDLVTQRAIDIVWGKADATPAGANLVPLKAGGVEKTMTITNLAEVVRGLIQAAILDVSDLSDGSGTLAVTDYMLVTQGTTGKRITVQNLYTAIYAGLAAHVAAATLIASGDAADVLYAVRGATPYRITLAQIATYVAASAVLNGSGTAGYLAKWADSDTLQAGPLVTEGTFGAGDNSGVPTTLAVRTELNEVVNDATDIGVAVADADTILVYDDSATAQRKSAISRLWTWIKTKTDLPVAMIDWGTPPLPVIQIDSLDVVGTGTDYGAPLADTDLLVVGYPPDGLTYKSELSRIYTYIQSKLTLLDIPINAGTDIGAALADGDFLPVYDLSATANRKSAMSRIYTYLQSKWLTTDVPINAGTDIGAALADGDLLIAYDLSATANRKSAVSRIYTYLQSKWLTTDIPINAGTDIGADLADGDLAVVYDLSATANRKSAVSRFWTYVASKLPTNTAIVGLASYTVAGLPAATTAGQIIYVSNETGGAVLAFADGTNWRRVTDRAIVS